MDFLNDLVQPFKSGVVADIGMQAVVEERVRRGRTGPPYLVPMAIEVSLPPAHPSPPGSADTPDGAAFIPGDPSRLAPRRLGLIMAELLRRQEAGHHLEADPGRVAELSERVKDVRQQVLAQAEEHYAASDRRYTSPGRWIGRGGSSSYLRGMLRQGRRYTAEDRAAAFRASTSRR